MNGGSTSNGWVIEQVYIRDLCEEDDNLRDSFGVTWFISLLCYGIWEASSYWGIQEDDIAHLGGIKMRSSDSWS
jgi:hypothetical protein